MTTAARFRVAETFDNAQAKRAFARGEIVEAVWLALIKLGVPVMIGGFCDYGLMYRHQRKELREFLADSWLRLSEVKWPTFGRVEAEQAVGFINRIAGERLLSKQRVIFTASVGLGVILIASVVVAAHQAEWKPAVFVSSELLLLTVVGGNLFALALSVSVSQTISRAVLAVPPRYTTPAFFVQFCIHGLLLVLWGPAVRVLLLAPIYVYIANANGHWNLAESLWSGYRDLLSQTIHASFGWLDNKDECADVADRDRWGCLLGFVVMYAGDMTGLVANGLRLLLSTSFLMSYVAYRLVGDVVGKLWANLAESEWPIFTTLFGLLGAIWAACSGIGKMI